MRDKRERAFHVIVVSLDGTAFFVAERTVIFRVALGAARINVGSLQRGHHRVLAVTEVICFHEHGRTKRRTRTVLGIAIVVVVIDVSAVITHTRMAAIGMVVPIVVIRNVKTVGRAFREA